MMTRSSNLKHKITNEFQCWELQKHILISNALPKSHLNPLLKSMNDDKQIQVSTAEHLTYLSMPFNCIKLPVLEFRNNCVTRTENRKEQTMSFNVSRLQQQTHFFGFLDLISTGGPGGPMVTGKMSTHI